MIDTHKRLSVTLFSVVCLVSSAIQAETFDKFAEPADESSQFEAEVLLSGLKNPAGITLSPTQSKTEPVKLFIAESGAGRVISVVSTAADNVNQVVVDFPIGSLGDYRVGPMGLGFVAPSKLAVVANQGSDEQPEIRVFEIRKNLKAQTASAVAYVAELANKTSESPPYRADHYGLAFTSSACYLTGANGGANGWILKCKIEANRLSPLQKIGNLSHTGSLAGFLAPTVVPSPRPAYLVAAMTGSFETPQDSRLGFFLPDTGELVMNLPTGLHDIVALAYSRSGQLYAADFSWTDEQTGGVYRLDDARVEGRQSCRAVKIAPVVRPFGLAFAPDGSLFVTSFGTVKEPADGKLIKITGSL